MPIIVGGNVIEGSEPPEFSGAGVPSAGTDEVQTITIGGSPEVASTFTLTYDGWKTGKITWSSVTNTLIANILAALVALPNIGGAGVTVADGTSTLGVGTFTVTFVTANGKTDVSLMTAGAILQSDDTASASGTIVVATTTPGVTATGRGAATGTEYTNITTGVRYVNTGTAAAPTWTTVSDTLGTSYLGGVTPGTITASKAAVVDSGKAVNEWNVTGTETVVGVITQSKTSATADAGTVRGVHGQVTASHGAISAGSIAGVRGLATVSGIVSAGGLYAYGAQGKLVVSGTMNHADSRLCGLLAQLDISAGVYTAGQISALWVDAGATSVAGALGGQFNMLRITNTTVSVPNAVIYAYSEGSFLLDLDGPGGNADWYTATAAGGATRSHKLKVKVGGTTGYISVYTD